MGFRDEELAQRERVETLEREVERLHEENAQLRSGPPVQPRAPRRSRLGAVSLSLALLAPAVGIGAIALGTDPESPVATVLVVAVAFLLQAAVLLAVVARHLVVVPPDRVAVLSGRQTVGPDGEVRGYRLITGGRTLRIPIIERNDELPLGPYEVDLDIQGTYLRGNAYVRIRGRGRVRVVKEPPHVHRAIERFLGNVDDLSMVAEQTLEGIVREVAAKSTLDELRDDRDEAAARIAERACEDLSKLGLALDTFHIEHVEPM